MISVSVQQAPFALDEALAPLEALGGGAVASFVGLVRADGDVEQLTLEHYPVMTETALRGIAEQASARWSLLGATIIHRVGPMQPGERIVLAAACAPHRRDALDACAFMIDRLKTDAPFWKSESRVGQANWVEARESDEAAASRWSP
ncbi:molybdenum cofactor biosynthesis protein MoaE [Sphingomonas sp.]|jgi:molybdopterin synthase catalytic subunit|uniref:molybdenum cofactor biosynthesis protein MoaE n=1 Tax=Sphingomonas sp. TaxID=28214 RepID=UPI002DEF5084|nr:molybdenum cofactor biosynthesis protein MoaE [Sphingomonas sp.]